MCLGPFVSSCVFSEFLSFWLKLGQFGSKCVILDHFRSFCALWLCLSVSVCVTFMNGSFWGHLESFWLFFGHLAILTHFVSYWVTWAIFVPFWSFRDILCYFGVILGHFGHFGIWAITGHFGSFLVLLGHISSCSVSLLSIGQLGSIL